MEKPLVLIEENGSGEFEDTLRQFCISAADYRVAIAEFDRLWETGATGQEQKRMRQLLKLIESFESENFPVEFVAGSSAGES